MFNQLKSLKAQLEAAGVKVERPSAVGGRDMAELQRMTGSIAGFAPTVTIADFRGPTDDELQHNQSVLQSEQFEMYAAMPNFSEDTKCVKFSIDGQQAVALGEALDAAFRNGVLEIPASNKDASPHKVVGGWSNVYEGVVDQNKAKQQESVVVLPEKGNHVQTLMQRMPPAQHLLEELMFKMLDERDGLFKEKLGKGRNKMKKRQVAFFFGVNRASSFEFHRDTVTNELSSAMNKEDWAGATTVTLLSSSRSSMQVAGGKEVYYEKPGETVLFNADLFHRSGEAYPGTIKMAVHWVRPGEEPNGEGASASGEQSAAAAANEAAEPADEVQDDAEDSVKEEQTPEGLKEAVGSADEANSVEQKKEVEDLSKDMPAEDPPEEQAAMPPAKKQKTEA